MDESKTDLTDSASDEPKSTQRKKRTHSRTKTLHNDYSRSSLGNKGDCNNGEEESKTSGTIDDSTRKKGRSSLENDISMIRDRKIRQIRLEAIFHPKFENESSDKDIRKEILNRVENGEGYLEVTLKHSGSLLLWSGGSRFYSKNDTNNKVTLVGELLLRRHISLVWETEHDTCNTLKYNACSNYIQEHRLTLAFEVVTSVLGDHGDIPKLPYLILLSVADRNAQRFYSSQKLIEFAQEFRLPHNDYWIFAIRRSCEGLFQFYDDIREVGTTDTVIKGLDQLIKCTDDNDSMLTYRLVSMYPHVEYQGQILEGLVVRFVCYDTVNTNDSNHSLQALGQLARTSTSFLEIFTNAKANMPIQSDYLDDFFSSDSIQKSNSELKLRSFLKVQYSGNDYQQLIRATGIDREGDLEIYSLISSLLDTNNEIIDDESKQIIQLMHTLNELGAKIKYKLYCQSKQKVKDCSQNQRWICIIQVMHDETFRKYSHIRKLNEMNLFRGFSIELLFDNIVPTPSNAPSQIKPCHVESNPLMLKMKFLPYMIRTFGCRNGLQILARMGIEKYEHFTLDLLQKWNISHHLIKQWQPYLYSWGLYAESKLKQIDSSDCYHFFDGNTYLKHLSSFDTLYHTGQLETLENNKSKCNGLIIIVSLNKEESNAIGDFLASKLGIYHRLYETGSITNVDMLSSLCGNPILCTTTVTDTEAPIRKLLKNKQYSEAIRVILFGCSQDDIDQRYELNSSKYKRISGKMKAWSRIRCKEVINVNTIPATEIGESIEAMNIADKLIQLSGSDGEKEKLPGILVFFPGIPGSGKSYLCGHDSRNIELGMSQFITIENRDDYRPRPVIISEGDGVKGKYWESVLVDRLKSSESIYLTDKNATPHVWDTIRDICNKSLGLFAPVLPDSHALSTVSVKHSDEECHYPYSLSYLAVCMLRVVMRPKETHKGKLDESTDYALLVVVMFYSLYRGISAENILSKLNKTSFGNSGAYVITIPFFSETKQQELPKDLRDGLIDALHFQYSIDHKMTYSEEEKRRKEERLRKLVITHQDFLLSMCAPESDSKEAFLTQLAQLVSTLPDNKQKLDHEIHHKFIEIASIDIDQGLINNALKDIAKVNVDVESFLTRVTSGVCSEINEGDFVEKTHVTLAHFSQLSQLSMHTKYSHLHGHIIAITITGILIGKSVAALSVRLPEFVDDKKSCSMPSCCNSFPHITIWVGNDGNAATANNLPAMVEKRDAIRIDLVKSIEVPGKFGFWYI